MKRFPRNDKRDKLISSKLISFSYLQIGVLQACAGMFTYFIVLNDYGIKPETLFYFINEEGQFPNKGDFYNAKLIYKGNSLVKSPSDDTKLNLFDDNRNNGIDLRLFYYHLAPNEWEECRWNQNNAYPEI